MFSVRTLISLSQYLGPHNPPFAEGLFRKHGIPLDLERQRYRPGPPTEILLRELEAASGDQVHELLNEMIRTIGDLRSRISPRYRHDERWRDLMLCLELDGYRFVHHRLVPIGPAIEEAAPPEDDLSVQLQASALPSAGEITVEVNRSTDAFRRSPADYNACLTHARIALQLLATSIAETLKPVDGGEFDERKWGDVLRYLRAERFITLEEERGLAGVYGFVSPGAHQPVGLAEEEMAWLGRSLAISMCWFLVRRYNAAR